MTTESQTDDGLGPSTLATMTRILGADRARHLFQRLVEQEQRALQTPDDLFAFGEALRRFGGFEAAVGAMLQVQAVMRGSRGR